MSIKPFSNLVKFIPKDPRGKYGKGQIYPADHFEVSATDIAALDAGASPDLVNPDGGGSGNSGGGEGISIENLVPSLKNINPSQDQTVVLFEPTGSPYSMTVTVEHNKIEEVRTTYQWQESTDGGSTWSDMSGETTTTLSLSSGRTNSQSGYKYRLKLENPDAVQTPVYSGVWTINVNKVISIIAQPTFTATNQGDQATIQCEATITSGTIDHQWQKQDAGTNVWSDISGASGTGTASGSVISYQTPVLDIEEDTDDQYRVVLSATDAADVNSSPVTVVVLGADFRVQPAINNVEFWDLEENGALIFDPTNATNYTITSLSNSRTKFISKMWGQGSCSSQGGHSYGEVPLSGGDQFKVQLNAGRGVAGNGQHGGGYAGLFEGTTVSQSSALLIAGGAGSGGDDGTDTCGRSGGAGGGTSGGDGTDKSADLTGGDGGTQSAGGSGGAATGAAAGTTFSQTYTSSTSISIPAGVLSVSYTIHGSKGSVGGNGSTGWGSGTTPTYGGQGSRGQKLTGVLTGVAGQTLDISINYYTGGSGGPPGTGSSGQGFYAASGGAGGAASVIRIGSTTLATAGGGGGGGGGGYSSYVGWHGINGLTSTILNDTLVNNACGNGVNGYGHPNSSMNSGGGGGGGGCGPGAGGSAINSGNLFNGEGGYGGEGYYNTSYHTSVPSLQTPDSDTSYIEITYVSLGSDGADGAALQGGNGGTSGAAVGQDLFAVAGTQSWTCPDGVTSVSMVLIGGGCGGAGGYGAPNRAQGGKGGQLLYVNDVEVNSGETYTVVVGTGGVVPTTTQTNNFVNGTASVFRNSNSTKILSASGGQGRTTNSAAQVTGFTTGSYSSHNGGDGGYGNINDNGTGYPGEGGGAGNYNSGGANGGTDSSSSYGGTGPGTGVLGSNTGDYGAGGNGSHYTWTAGTSGVNGAVRIIWGEGRSYPSTDVADQTTSAGSGSAGGAGGGGYFGGGGGAAESTGSAAGGGGSGYVDSTLSNAATSAFAGSSDTNRGTAGNVDGNSRVVIDPTYIEITSQPSSQVLESGATSTFSVTATVNGLSGATINYQWQKAAAAAGSIFSDISGATSSSYTTGSLTTSNNLEQYRCKITNQFCNSKFTEEVLTLVSGGGSQTYVIESTGLTTIPLTDATEFSFKIWGAGGGGTGEGCGGPYSGGAGGFGAKTVTVPSGDTSSLSVFVGATGLGDTAAGLTGYGAGRGGQRTYISWTPTGSGSSLQWFAGGGGGAGQAGNGGGGGGISNGSGGNGSGPNAGSGASVSGGGGGGSSNGGNSAGTGVAGNSGGGVSGGSGINQGNRGGGGGSGYFGGGGGAGDNTGNNCTGGGAGGGSGATFEPSFSGVTTSNSLSQNGSSGSGSGAAAPYSTDPDYVAGRGANNGHGLAVVSVVVPGIIQMTGINSGTQTNISNLSSTTTLSEPAYIAATGGKNYSVTIRLRGGSPSGTGGYVQGTFTVFAGQTYRLHYDSKYAAVFLGTSVNGDKCVMLAAEGGYQGNGVYGGTASGGNAGYPSGGTGSNLNNSGGGTGGTTSGYKSGSGGTGGAAGQSDGYSGSPGGDGGFFSAGNGGSGVDGNGGSGGMGYYGGGGGGGGWDLQYNAGGEFGGGGGGGSSYYGGLPSSSGTQVTVTSTSAGTESGGTQIQIISVAEV